METNLWLDEISSPENIFDVELGFSMDLKESERETHQELLMRIETAEDSTQKSGKRKKYRELVHEALRATEEGKVLKGAAKKADRERKRRDRLNSQ